MADVHPSNFCFRLEAVIHHTTDFSSNNFANEKNMRFLTDVSPVLIPILALLVPIVGIIAWATVKISRMNSLHETVRHLSSNGQPIPPELLAEITDRKRS